MKLEFTHASMDDIRSIRAYTLQNWGTEQEQRYLDQLWDKFAEIFEEPSKFRFRQDLFPECQIAAERKHVILFRIRRGSLQVVRVLHSAMDFKRHIPPEVGPRR